MLHSAKYKFCFLLSKRFNVHKGNHKNSCKQGGAPTLIRVVRAIPPPLHPRGTFESKKLVASRSFDTTSRLCGRHFVPKRNSALVLNHVGFLFSFLAWLHFFFHLKTFLLFKTPPLQIIVVSPCTALTVNVISRDRCQLSIATKF